MGCGMGEGALDDARVDAIDDREAGRVQELFTGESVLFVTKLSWPATVYKEAAGRSQLDLSEGPCGSTGGPLLTGLLTRLLERRPRLQERRPVFTDRRPRLEERRVLLRERWRLRERRPRLRERLAERRPKLDER